MGLIRFLLVPVTFLVIIVVRALLREEKEKRKNQGDEMPVSGADSEMAIRRRITNIYNKREEDFPSSREHNDYLEDREDITDVPAIEERIREYEKENAELITINRARKAEELIAALAASKGLPAQNNNDGNSQGGQPRPLGRVSQIGADADCDEESMKIRAEKGSRAAGWSKEFHKKRALEDAFSSIWI